MSATLSHNNRERYSSVASIRNPWWNFWKDFATEFADSQAQYQMPKLPAEEVVAVVEKNQSWLANCKLMWGRGQNNWAQPV